MASVRLPRENLRFATFNPAEQIELGFKIADQTSSQVKTPGKKQWVYLYFNTASDAENCLNFIKNVLPQVPRDDIEKALKKSDPRFYARFEMHPYTISLLDTQHTELLEVLRQRAAARLTHSSHEATTLPFPVMPVSQIPTFAAASPAVSAPPAPISSPAVAAPAIVAHPDRPNVNAELHGALLTDPVNIHDNNAIEMSTVTATSTSSTVPTAILEAPAQQSVTVRYGSLFACTAVNNGAPTVNNNARTAIEMSVMNKHF
jgi:hypothetical protein